MRRKTVNLNGKEYLKVVTDSRGKLSKIMVAICLIVFCTSCHERRSGRGKNPNIVSTSTTVKTEKNNFIHFSSKYVTETLHQGATGFYYVVYNDIDLGMDNELLQVDTETFRRIEAAMSTQAGKLRGYLVEKEGEFTYCHDKP